MSDRLNRDRGKKLARERPTRWACSCWLCVDGATKVKELKDKSLRKDKLTKFVSQLEE